MKLRILLAIAVVNIFPHVSVADNSSTPIICYGQSSQNSPRYRFWGGSSWNSEQTMPSIGAEPYWIVVRNCPQRDEYCATILDKDKDVHALIYNGASWSGTQFSNSCDDNTTRCFDVAYEQSSGDALVAYFDVDQKQIAYYTWSGSSWSGPTRFSLPSGDLCPWIVLRPDPTSDRIMLVAQHKDMDLSAREWSGTAWGSWATLETGVHTNTEQCFDFAYESQSGGGVVVYCQSNSGNPRTRTWNGSSWSSESSMASIGYYAKWIRLSSDPASDQILCGALDSGNDVNVFSWNGSSWSSRQELETSTAYSDRRQFDIAYESGGGEALICYAESGNNRIQYRTWNGSSWSSEQDGTQFGDYPRIAQAHYGVATGEVLFATIDNDTDVATSTWSGASFSGATEVETSGVSESYQCFMISGPTPQIVVPADIPYFTDFESGVGAEWNNSTTDTNGTLTTFLGRFNKTAVQIALNTVIGETYTLDFDLYAIDSWNPSGGTSHDAFAISVNGVQAFNEAFSQRPGSYPPTFPNPPRLQGDYGYGSYEEGVYDITVTFVASATVTTIAFEDNLDQDVNDESTGIDNVRVTLSRFRDVSVAKGFDVQTSTGNASGISFADLDNDGDLDGLLGGNNTARRMLNNNEGASFTSSTLGSGNERRQHALLDIDNDGDVDFWSGNHNNSYDVEACFENNGAGGLSDAGTLGFGDPSNNEGVAAADVNRDGWCDIVHFSGNYNWVGEHQGDPGGSSVQLNGSNASSIGLNDSGDYGNGDYCSSGDVNNDGYLDFFYHYGTGKLFLSTNPLEFSEGAYGISVLTGNSDKFGSAWGDYDNDGDLDLYASRYDANNTGYLWRNDVTWTATPTGSFTNRTSAAYILDESGQRSCAWGDYDNDGDLDLYVVTRSGGNRLYANQNDGTFRLMDEGADVTGNCHDAVFVDYDNDGDLDIAVTRESTTAVMLENRTDNSNYLKVRLVGGGTGNTNLAAVGVRVELWNGAGTIRRGRRDIGVARGFGGTEPLWAHFGGVNPADKYMLRIWFHSLDNASPMEVYVIPNTVSTTIGSVTIDQMITVSEATKKRILFWQEVRNRP